MARPLGEERPQRGQPVRARSTSTHRKRVSLTACLSPARRRADGGSDEHLLAAVGVRAPRARAAPQPVASAGPPPGRKWSARRRVVICSRPSRRAPAASSTSPSVCSCRMPSCSARWRSGASGAGEDAPVSEPHAAAQPLARRCVRGAGRGRRWLRASDPPCSGMASPGAGPVAGSAASTVVR